ncbi:MULTISPECIES: hypothetical protein [Pseudomonas]|uniref:hypothetical protein n=1 Tax=Pseudomonas TaxID=286 RepID=UPI0011B01778|nr:MULTISPECIES: hypothetical protein [Pseudomonas]
MKIPAPAKTGQSKNTNTSQLLRAGKKTGQRVGFSEKTSIIFQRREMKRVPGAWNVISMQGTGTMISGSAPAAMGCRR